MSCARRVHHGWETARRQTRFALVADGRSLVSRRVPVGEGEVSWVGVQGVSGEERARGKAAMWHCRGKRGRPSPAHPVRAYSTHPQESLWPAPVKSRREDRRGVTDTEAERKEGGQFDNECPTWPSSKPLPRSLWLAPAWSKSKARHDVGGCGA